MMAISLRIGLPSVSITIKCEEEKCEEVEMDEDKVGSECKFIIYLLSVILFLRV
jgi:hypothetical protein